MGGNFMKIFSVLIKLASLIFAIYISASIYFVFLIYSNIDRSIFSGWQIPLVYATFGISFLFLIYFIFYKKWMFGFITVCLLYLLSVVFVNCFSDFDILKDRARGSSNNYYSSFSYTYINEKWCGENNGYWDSVKEACFYQ